MRILPFFLFSILLALPGFCKNEILFSGKDLDAFELRPGSWEIESDKSVVCRMERTTDKKGVERLKGMGFLWTKHEFGDFALSLEYKLSAGANSGIFYRTDKTAPVQGGSKFN